MSDLKSNFVKLEPVRGWIFDVYPCNADELAVWIIAENGERMRLVDKFTHRIYVSGDLQGLKDLAKKIKRSPSVDGLRFVEKCADFMKATANKVLEVDLADYGRASILARKILRFGVYERFRLFNVDVPVAQAYLYERDIFPLAHVLAVDAGNRVSYDVLDSVESVDYAVPPLRSMWLNVEVRKEKVAQRLTDPIDSISLEFDEKTVAISAGSEKNKLLRLVKTVKEENPDIVLTHGGDSFVFPYLSYRAFANGVSERLVLGREDVPLRAWHGGGRSFFSYGRVYHKSPVRRLYGRVHVDVDNTFIYTACGLEGLVELSRTCRVPLQTAARASIGTIMSSLQLHTAWHSGVLIPWKKTEPEAFKTGWKLLVADRGGFIYEPKVGFHTDIVEVDFVSMFPMLMLKHNLSAETVLCKCCPDSQTRVPELDYNVCEKRLGIVPKTLDLLLRKRSKYKGLMKETQNKELRHVCNMQQSALKWILVTCFGYLGYRNARFGKVDAHISVCAFARDSLLRAARMAEAKGFEVVHGIVDSLWLKKTGATPKEVAELCREVSEAVSVPLNVEGRYRWIVFLPSKMREGVPVLNRYYGAFENGTVKMRGVEARRNDTPAFICSAQIDMIKKLAAATNLEAFKEEIPEAFVILRDYINRLVRREVDVHDLLIAKRLSKTPSQYMHNLFLAIAAKQLEKNGFEVHSGQTVQYVITNAKSKSVNERVTVAQLLTTDTKYDVQEYVNMLVSATETLFGVFGHNEDDIRTEVQYSHRIHEPVYRSINRSHFPEPVGRGQAGC